MKQVIKLLVDRSGSMAQGKEASNASIKSFIDERLKVGGSQKISISQFDSTYEEVYPFTKLEEAPEYSLEPRGMTALNDSIAKAVKELEDYKPDTDRERWLIILTDGFENASKEHTRESIKKLLEEKQEKGWHVVYLGANQDAVSVGTSYGIPGAMSVTYDAYSEAGSKSALRGVSCMMSSPTNYSFTDEDRYNAMVGDSDE